MEKWAGIIGPFSMLGDLMPPAFDRSVIHNPQARYSNF